MKKNNIKGGHMMERLFYRFKRGVEPMKRVLIYGLVVQLAFPVPPAFALPIEVDPSNPMTNAPTLDKAQNGVDIVNIANPTRAGVSANKFRDYNVPVSGVIMNNSLAIARSQLGGVINANQQLVDGKSADLVLFQVTGVGESQLRGYSEMHGASADFILANPNGISINGGGFIGTPRVTLTTGVPGFNSMGGIDDISVSQGAVRIDGDGFNASNVDYVAIWARTMALHGAYYAKHADIKLGTNDINYATGAMTVLTDGNGAPSAFALDASALGAMHADSIALVSTEDGVGVRSRADIVAQSGELTLQSNGQLVVHHIQAKGDATLVAAGDIEQTGASYSAQTLRMESASDIALRGESVSAAQQVLVTANGDVALEKTASLGNESPFLVATSAAISGDDVRLASADVMVMDTLDVDANGQLTIESSQLVARSQAVSAEAMVALDSDVVGGAIAVDVANELTLGGMVVSTGDLGISAGRMQQSGVIFSSLDTNVMVDDVLVNEGDILAGGTLTVHDREGGKAQRVVNAQGVMEAEGDVLIRANEIHNIGVVETETSTDVSGQYWAYPTSKRKQLHTLRSVMRVKDGTHIQAVMGSGGRMTLDGDVTNVVSVLAAGDDLHITGDLDNQGVDLLATYDVDTHDEEVVRKKEVFDGYRTVWKKRLAVKKKCGLRVFGKCRFHVLIPYLKHYKSSKPRYRYDSVYGWVSKGRTQSSVALATVSAVAQAQGAVSVDGDIKNGTVTHGASYMARSGLGQGAAPMDRQSLAVMVGALDMASGLSLPTSGLFITQTAPGHRYLIETNSAYIDTQRFIGSSYFLDRMGFSDMTARLLGDAFFETRLVRDSIMSLGHRRFLSADIDSDEAQMTILYDNAVAAAESLGLKIGQALTPDQVAALDNDMLWLVKTTVQGETVLAPTLYLSSATRATLRDQRMNGSVLAGQNIMGETGVYNGGVMHAVGDMIFNATGIQNSGQLMAGNALTMNAQGTVHHSGMLQAMTLQGTMGSLDSRGDIHATGIDVDVHGDILHSGDMQADQSLALRSGGAVTHSGTMAAMETTIDATNDIRNTGRLSGEDSLTLTSTDGSVVNDVTVTTHRLDGYVTDEVANVGVMATNGTLRMTAGGDVVNHATLDVQGDAMIAADGDIKLIASALTQSVIDDGYSIDRTHHQGSSTTIGGHLTASSGQDILVQGSALSVGRDADMDAGGDVTIESVATVRADQSLKGRSSHQWVDHDGASVAVGGDLNASGDDISIDGSEVSVKHHGRLDARGNVSIASVQNAESLNRSFSRVSQTGSQLSAGESLTLTSGKDIEIEASEVSSGDQMGITTGGDLKVLSASDTMQSTHTNYEVSMFGGVKRTTVKESSVTHRASTLRSGGHAVIQTGGDVTVLGSNVDVDGHAVIQSKGDVKVLAGDAGHDVQTSYVQGNYFSESKGSSRQSSLEKVGSTVTVDGGLVVTSQGKAMLQAANLDVGGLELRAEKGVSVLSAETQTVSVSESTTKGWFNKHHKKDESVTTDHDASVVASRSDVTMATNGGLTIAGSEIRSAGNTDLSAAKAVAISSVAAVEKKKTVSESSGFSGISLSSTRSSLSLNIENKGTRDELDATTVTQRGSHVSVGGDLTISSGETATVMGSDVVAVGDIDVEGESVHIVSAEASQAIMETHAKTKDTVSLTVGNAWLETAYSAKDAADAVIDAVQAGESMDTSTKEGRINKAAADAQAVASAVKLANSVAQSAGSVATAGFYGAVSATHEETSETTSTTATQARGAQLVSLNGSTTLDAANDLRIEGSTVAAQQGDVTLKGTEVTIEAAKNTHQTTVRSDHQRTTAEVFNTAGMPTLPTHTQQEFSGDATTITHAQSRVQAGSGKVTIETSGDATVTGAQVEGSDVAMDVGGTLTVSSVQNSTTSRGRTTGVSVGGTMGIDNGHQRTDRAWVDEQTHVVGSDSVNVEAKTLALTGAVVANASIERDAYGKVDKMTDQGNLTIEVADVTVADVSNRDEHESSHVGVDVSGFSGAVQVPQGGSMGIRVSTGGHRKAGVTATTLGQGSLSAERVTVVTSDKSKTGVNRDLSSRQVTHVDETTGGLDVNIRVDNRLLTDTTDYVVEGAKNTVGLVGNTAQAVANGSRVAANLGAAVVDNVTGNGHDGVAADFQGRLRNQELGLQSKINDDLVLALNQLSEDPKAAEAALAALANQAVHANGIEGDVAVAFYNSDTMTPEQLADVVVLGENYGKDDFAGFYDPESETIYLNVAKMTGSHGQITSLLANELSHYVDEKKGRSFDQRRQDISTELEANMLAQYVGMNGESIVNDEQKAQFQANIEMHDFSEGNVGAGGVERPEPAYFAKRPLKGYPWLGLLSNNSVDDQSNTELSHEHIFFEDEEGGNIGFFNDTNSPRPDEVSQLSKYKPSQDGGYDDAIMREAVKQVSPKNYKLCGVNQYNCQDWAQDVREKYFELESLNN